MKVTGARAADPEVSKVDTEKRRQKVSINLTVEQIEDRTNATTESLADIVERQEGRYLRHWGLNE